MVIDNKDKPNADDNAQGDQGGLGRLNKMQEAELIHQQKLRQQAEMSAANAGV